MYDIIGLQPGDIFCTASLEPLGYTIRAFQKFGAVDNSVLSNHTGIVVNSFGDTLEALYRVCNKNLYHRYAGQRCVVGRHRGMTKKKFEAAYSVLHKKYYGGYYPIMRLPLIGLFPRLSKYVYWGRPVCSELAWRLLNLAGLYNYWKSVTPSYVEDAIRNWDAFDVIYDSHLPAIPRLI